MQPAISKDSMEILVDSNKKASELYILLKPYLSEIINNSDENNKLSLSEMTKLCYLVENKCKKDLITRLLKSII